MSVILMTIRVTAISSPLVVRTLYVLGLLVSPLNHACKSNGNVKIKVLMLIPSFWWIHLASGHIYGLGLVYFSYISVQRLLK